MKVGYLAAIAALLLYAGCRNRHPQPPSHPPSVIRYQVEPGHDGDQPRAPYRPSTTKHHDLIHTALDLRFDWDREEVMGKATLRMRPWFYATNGVVLDAKGFLIHRVALKTGETLQDLRYHYDLMRLAVLLGRDYTREEEFELYIEYTARPALLDSLLPQAAAEEQGIYFVKPDEGFEDKPYQIWTQGEAHGASGWFPTFDQPNERCTQETRITVADSFVTLSNGLLVSSTRNTDGTRTDHWKMNQPHAPYLFMLAVGEFIVTKDQWRGKEVSYYLEPKYAPYARLIFGNTPEMIEFFSKRLGVDYPWDKYSQIVVRDFVSGAMENTTATIHFAQVQHDAREHLDATQEDFISHELFHQWFGDLVTCESWANLTLNEGFATYGEYLWKEYKYGLDEAQLHLEGDLGNYLMESAYKQEYLIRYRHNTPNDMFDGHSYQKGGLVLHMLRDYVGDSAFFQSLQLYLKRNAFTEVEAAELRLAFEDVTGEDLNWFFDQWYMGKGHPQLAISHAYTDGAWTIRVSQLQDTAETPIFRFPVRVELGRAGKPESYWIMIERQDSTYRFATAEQPDYAAFNADQTALAMIASEDKPMEAWVAQYLQGKTYAVRSEALIMMEAGTGGSPQPEVWEAILKAVKDPFWAIRNQALSLISGLGEDHIIKAWSHALARMNDPHPEVRAQAVSFFDQRAALLKGKLLELEWTALVTSLEAAAHDSSYSVQETGLAVLHQYDSRKALAVARELAPQTPERLVSAVGRILLAEQDAGALNFLKDQLNPQKEAIERNGAVRLLGEALEIPAMEAQSRALLMEVADRDPIWWIRYSAAQALLEGGKNATVKGFFEERAEREANGNLRAFYKKRLADW